MFGFDNYLPSKWLDGVLAIHVEAPKTGAPKQPFRAGKWLAKAAVAATFLTAGAAGAVGTSVQIALPQAVTVEVVPDAGSFGVSVKELLFAPAGYFAKLQVAIAQSDLLPEQSTEADPEFAF